MTIEKKQPCLQIFNFFSASSLFKTLKQQHGFAMLRGAKLFFQRFFNFSFM
jgi:hypothetical protein